MQNKNIRLPEKDRFDELLRVLGDHLKITHEGINWASVNSKIVDLKKKQK